jgi:hypothetical protein
MVFYFFAKVGLCDKDLVVDLADLGQRLDQVELQSHNMKQLGIRVEKMNADMAQLSIELDQLLLAC